MPSRARTCRIGSSWSRARASGRRRSRRSCPGSRASPRAPGAPRPTCARIGSAPSRRATPRCSRGSSPRRLRSSRRVRPRDEVRGVRLDPSCWLTVLRGAMLALLAAPSLSSTARAGAEAPADLVFTGGAVYTVDAERSWAQAVAVRGGRIVYVGNDAGARPFVGAKTRVVALAGRMLLPGFQDAHVHPLSAGIEHGRCDLGGLATREAVLAGIRRCAAGEKGPWLVGSGWELDFFPDGNPDRRILDELVPDRPAFFWAADGHSSWVNSRALALAGIDASTPDPPKGRIERDPKTHEPSGALRESASELVERLLPQPTPEERRAALRWATGQLVALGITAAQDADVRALDLAAYRDADRRGELPMRIVAALSTAEALEALPEDRRGDAAAAVASLSALRAEHAGRRLRPTAAKIFADGVIETRTAAMLEPY